MRSITNIDWLNGFIENFGKITIGIKYICFCIAKLFTVYFFPFFILKTYYYKNHNGYLHAPNDGIIGYK